VRQPNTLRPKALQQLRNSEEASLHVFRQGQQLGFHQIVQNLNRPLPISAIEIKAGLSKPGVRTRSFTATVTDARLTQSDGAVAETLRAIAALTAGGDQDEEDARCADRRASFGGFWLTRHRLRLKQRVRS